ncbi:MAG: hypothetical protein AMXMBFR34_08820 [Myxococcaceae bacterium]
MKAPFEDGVVLARGETGSSFLHRVLREARAKYPHALFDADLPESPAAFKRRFGDLVVEFEAARISSSERLEIARHLFRETQDALELAQGGKTRPLAEALADGTPPPELEVRAPSKAPGLTVRVPCDGRLWSGREALELIEQLHAAHQMTNAARRGLEWIIEHVEAAGGALDLSGHTFALLGAAAELSPAPLLLEAGATVRWIDLKAPSEAPESGTLVTAKGGDELLLRPQAVAASLRQLAEKRPLHLGLFAYAPGASRELRLAGVMDALARSLGPGAVTSVSMFVSPTSPGELQPEDQDVAAVRARHPKLWQRGLAMTRALSAPGHYGPQSAAVVRGPITLQGAAYLAAQYLTKIIGAEVFAIDGVAGAPVTLSVNVAGITRTRSLSHPVFQAAFRGAPAFGVRIFQPETTRALSGLLMLHDLLNPDAPGAVERHWQQPEARARAVRTEQLHGGAYDLPWQFESAVRCAAVLGAASNPMALLKRG